MLLRFRQHDILLRCGALALAAWTFTGLGQKAVAGDDTDHRLAALETDGGTARPELRFGIVPQQSASRLARMWGPLLTRLSDELGVDIRFETTKDIPTFEACLAAGAYDFAYMNPVHYTIFAEAAGYNALARQSDKRLRGLIVVRKDSPAQSLDDLSGAQVAFPSPGAFGASVVPRAEMRARGIAFEPEYVKSHDSVYRAVVAGLMPAGGGVLRTFNAISPELRDQLRVIYRTEGYTPHAIAARGDVPANLRAALQEVLMEINASAPELAKSVGMNGFETAMDGDWDDVRALGLGARDTGISTEGNVPCPSG